MTGVIREADFTYLDSGDEYARYHNQLGSVLERLSSWYRKAAREGGYEAGVVHRSMERLLYTIRALRVKYTYSPDHGPKIDLTDSGFPAALEIMAMANDLALRDETLAKHRPATLIKREMLDEMISRHREPTEQLQEMSEIAYMQMLDESRLFLSFGQDSLQLREENEQYRTYLYAWSCYDYSTSRPFIHLFTFDQDRAYQPLRDGRESWQRFVEVIRHEGSRAPDVGILAASIDDHLDEIHPRILKRVCLGPWFSPYLVKAHDYSEDPLCKAVTEMLLELSDEDDFVFFFDDEVIFSKKQTVAKTQLHPQGRVRQIFHIPESDPECYRRRASVVHRNVLLPHTLLQHIEEAGPSSIPGFTRCHKIVYTDEGTFHGV